ncbi:MAG: rhodanese-like domain-containing protein [Candidatus Latescibacteria bacterium]|nr:rhodanese-like domain-containing protein [Candidatus Latescibacterota bacterium]
MAVKQLEPQEAKTAMDEAENSVYLDVRTEMEFAQGHPEGAINIPIAVPGAAGMIPNPDFLNVVQKILSDKEQPVFCGCQSGMRSQMAADLMSRLGYSNLANVQGGFGGKVENGALVVVGWRDSNLPIETDVNESNSYASLKARAES